METTRFSFGEDRNQNKSSQLVNRMNGNPLMEVYGVPDKYCLCNTRYICVFRLPIHSFAGAPTNAGTCDNQRIWFALLLKRAQDLKYF